MAETIGIQGATLTHHINAMEADGLVTRRPDPANRRVHIVELTEAGERLYQHLPSAAVGFDRQLRASAMTRRRRSRASSAVCTTTSPRLTKRSRRSRMSRGRIVSAWAACGAGHLVKLVEALVSKLYMIVPLVFDIILQGGDDGA